MNGNSISILGYGAMRFPVKNGKIDEEKAREQLSYAIESGVNYIDTAYFYHQGQSEKFLGEFLSKGYRDKVFLASKMPPWLMRKEGDMEKIFKQQLKRLQTDFIDYYLLHAINRENWELFLKYDALKFIKEKKEQGQVKNLGFSFHGDKALFKEVIKAFPWDFCQIQYNFLDEQHQAGREGLELAESMGIPVIVMEPLRGGTLAQNLPSEVKSIYSQYDKKRTPVEWALKWIWNHKGVYLLLSGMSEMSHVVENIQYASDVEKDQLTSSDLACIEQVKSIYQSKVKVPCTSCQYCIPCPAHVDIPRCFELYNAKHMLNQEVKRFYLMQLSGINGQASHASLCIKCGQCLKKCPQNIDIITALADVSNDFEGWGFQAKIKLTKLLMNLNPLKYF